MPQQATSPCGLSQRRNWVGVNPLKVAFSSHIHIHERADQASNRKITYYILYYLNPVTLDEYPITRFALKVLLALEHAHLFVFTPFLKTRQLDVCASTDFNDPSTSKILLDMVDLLCPPR